MIPTVVVVPVKDQLDYTQSIITQLRYQPGWDELLAFDNGSATPTRRVLDQAAEEDERIHVVPAKFDGIYAMWSRGVAIAKRNHPGAVNVLLLNNDVILANRTVEVLASALRGNDYGITYPDYQWDAQHAPASINVMETHGTYRHGGMSGYCFMLAAELVVWEPLVDPQFRWWCGDDDIAFQMEAYGHKQGRVLGLGIDHVNEGTARHHAWPHEHKAADMQRCLTKWGR